MLLPMGFLENGTMTEPTDVTFKPEAETHRQDAETLATEAPPPGFPLGLPAGWPAQRDIEAWIRGEDGPAVGALLQGLDAASFDALVARLRLEGLLTVPSPPSHDQLDDLSYNRLPDIGALRVHYKNQELSRQRIHHLRFGWRELAGRPPAHWSVTDLFYAIWKIYQKGHPVDWTEMLTGVRDIWRLELARNRPRLEALWRSLDRLREWREGGSAAPAPTLPR